MRIQTGGWGRRCLTRRKGRQIGQGGVGAGESGLGVSAEGDGAEVRDAKLYGIEVGGDEGVFEMDGAGIEVMAGWGVSCTLST